MIDIVLPRAEQRDTLARLLTHFMQNSTQDSGGKR